MEENNLESKEGKVWLGDDGIIKIKTGEKSDLANAEKLVRQFIEITKTLKTKSRILIDVRASAPSFNVLYRKGLVKLFIDTFKDPGFEKAAFWGAKNKTIEIVGLFIQGATGLKNIRSFKNKEEALKWLKEK